MNFLRLTPLLSVSLVLAACSLGPKQIGDADTLGDDSSDSETGSTQADSTESDTTTADSTEADTDAETGETDPECTVAEDCKIFEDCCDCKAIPASDTPEGCPADCEQSACDATGLHGPVAACRLGACALEGMQCTGAICNGIPPACPEGQFARVEDDCWTGACIPAANCDELPVAGCGPVDCGDGFFCIEDQAGATRPHCEPLPDDCGGQVDCGCIAPWFSEICDASCGDGGGSILCMNGG